MKNKGESIIPGAAAIVFLASALLLLPWLGDTLFYSKGESREAVVAVSILRDGNWILPTYLGGEIPFKPPFLAWLIAIFAGIFNGGAVNEYISRLPSALACTGMIMASYHWGKKARGARFGIIYALITLTCFEVYRAAVVCRLDMLLTACMVTAMYILHGLTDEPRPRLKALRYTAAGMLLAAATLTKGPVGALLPCFIIGVYRLLQRKPFLPALAAMLALAAAAMIPAAIWFFLAYNQGGEHFSSLMYEENFGRLFGTMSYDSHLHPAWYNFVTLAAGLLPWTIMALLCAWQRSARIRPLTPAAVMSITAAAITILFYCIPASKRSVYLLPAYPFICYGLAWLADRRPSAPGMKAFAWFIALTAVIVPIAVAVADLMPQLVPAALQPMPFVRWLMLSLPIACGAAWIINRHSPVAHSLACVLSLYLVYGSSVSAAVLNPQSDAAAAAELRRLAAPGKPIAALNPWEQLRPYTINYYLGDSLKIVSGASDLTGYPSGTVVVVPAEADTAGMGAGYSFLPLTGRSCDSRRPMAAAVKQ